MELEPSFDKRRGVQSKERWTEDMVMWILPGEGAAFEIVPCDEKKKIALSFHSHNVLENLEEGKKESA